MFSFLTDPFCFSLEPKGLSSSESSFLLEFASVLFFICNFDDKGFSSSESSGGDFTLTAFSFCVCDGAAVALPLSDTLKFGFGNPEGSLALSGLSSSESSS
uniref:Uncharacterized protein n=1 Tax=Opuntia streptacantha TaxID=393608 RepID=A0A7C8Z491_OPUST